jgi:uncharacterized protein YkwD
VVDPVAPIVTPEPEVKPIDDDTVSRLLTLHNAHRKSPLTINVKLTEAAQKHAQWMASHRKMSHTGDGRSNPGRRITAAGYDWSTYGENVAYGQKSPDEVVRVWINSPGHRRNIKSEAYHEIGLGFATSSNNQIYWCVTFGSTTLSGDEWDASWSSPLSERSE